MPAKTITATVMTLGVLSLAGMAQAHAHLMSASPAPNVVVKSAPRSIQASFSEPLIAAFSKLNVATSKGAAVADKVTLAPGDAKTMVATFAKPLPAGDYQVHWKSVTADTHMMRGVYSFHVAP
jgi:methionine-rich copper-binding protein CopC